MKQFTLDYIFKIPISRKQILEVWNRDDTENILSQMM